MECWRGIPMTAASVLFLLVGLVVEAATGYFIYDTCKSYASSRCILGIDIFGRIVMLLAAYYLAGVMGSVPLPSAFHSVYLPRAFPLWKFWAWRTFSFRQGDSLLTLVVMIVLVPIGVSMCVVIGYLLYHTYDRFFLRVPKCELIMEMFGRGALIIAGYIVAGLGGCLPFPSFWVPACIPPAFKIWKFWKLCSVFRREEREPIFLPYTGEDDDDDFEPPDCFLPVYQHDILPQPLPDVEGNPRLNMKSPKVTGASTFYVPDFCGPPPPEYPGPNTLSQNIPNDTNLHGRSPAYPQSNLLCRKTPNGANPQPNEKTLKDGNWSGLPPANPQPIPLYQKAPQNANFRGPLPAHPHHNLFQKAPEGTAFRRPPPYPRTNLSQKAPEGTDFRGPPPVHPRPKPLSQVTPGVVQRANRKVAEKLPKGPLKFFTKLYAQRIDTEKAVSRIAPGTAHRTVAKNSHSTVPQAASAWCPHVCHTKQREPSGLQEEPQFKISL